MRARALLSAIILAGLMGWTEDARSGFSLIPQHDHAIGSCAPGLGPCTWDPNCQEDAICSNGESCQLNVTQAFSAHIVLSADNLPDDPQCTGSNGSHVTLGVMGMKQDGSTFTLPDTTLSFCGVDIGCDDLDPNFCGPGSFDDTDHPPGPVTFLCKGGFGGFFKESTLGGVGFWLSASRQPLLTFVRDELSEHFPSGTPIIDPNSVDCIDPNDSFCIDHDFSDDPNETVKHYCVTIQMVQLPDPNYGRVED